MWAQSWHRISPQTLSPLTHTHPGSTHPVPVAVAAATPAHPTAIMQQSPPQARRGTALLLLLALVGLGSLHAFVVPAPSASSSSSSSTLTKHAPRALVRGKVSAELNLLFNYLSFPLSWSALALVLLPSLRSSFLRMAPTHAPTSSPPPFPPSLPPPVPPPQPLFNGGSENQMMEDGQTVSSLMAEYNAVRREEGREGRREERGRERGSWGRGWRKVLMACSLFNSCFPTPS